MGAAVGDRDGLGCCRRREGRTETLHRRMVGSPVAPALGRSRAGAEEQHDLGLGAAAGAWGQWERGLVPSPGQTLPRSFKKREEGRT